MRREEDKKERNKRMIRKRGKVFKKQEKRLSDRTCTINNKLRGRIRK